MFQSTPNRWLVGGRPQSLGEIRLFAFAYAGGGASVFRQWNKILPPKIDVYAIQLPGRETRFSDPKITQFPAAVEAIAAALRPSLNHPFVFFGHSLGGLLAFETARQLRRLGAPTPVYLFLSGCSAPHVHDPIDEYSKLSDADFSQSVKKYGGMPDEVIKNTELLELFLPTLRADFSLFETYHYTQEPALDCPITAFGGLDDTETPQDKLNAWNIHTSKTFRAKIFPGNHFFLNTAQTQLIGEIARDLVHFPKE